MRDFFRHHVIDRVSPRQQNEDSLQDNAGLANDETGAIGPASLIQSMPRSNSMDMPASNAASSATLPATSMASPKQSQQRDRLSTLLEVPRSTTIREEQLTKMFYGAPSFRVDGSQQYPLPRATYEDLDPESFMEVNDFRDLGHSSFQLATLQTSDGNNFLGNAGRSAGSAVESPSMLSSNGLEPGTVGLDHFLTLPLESSATTTHDVPRYSRRRLLESEPQQLGLHHCSLEDCIMRLAEYGDEHARTPPYNDNGTGPLNEQKVEELHLDLFSKLLSRAEEDKSTGLDSQISALIKTLNEPEFWYDFSHPDQRLYIGQTLWMARAASDDETSFVDRDVLLLQLTLAAELLHRLQLKQTAKNTQTPAETSARRKDVISRKVSWDLVLAKRFLQNVRIAAEIPGINMSEKPKRHSILSMLSFVTAREDFVPQEQAEPVFYPRHERTQLQGLRAFAKTLDWPVPAELKQKISTHSSQEWNATERSYSRPVATPSFKPDDRSGYFGVLIRPTVIRSTTSHSLELSPPMTVVNQPESLNASGWLSRSWLTGMVMPGEAACHLLMAALLENTTGALQALGDTPNFGGGFYYKSRSYWSKTCVVGRVLGAMLDAKDCMGWVSIPRRTDNRTDGWISIDSQIVPSDRPLPRIKLPNEIASDSAPFPPLPDDNASFNETDFTWPSDGPPDPNSQVQAITLDFAPSERTFELSALPTDRGFVRDVGAISTLTAMLSFSPPPSTKALMRTALDLRYEVQFVSSQPCFPKMRGPPTHSAAPSPATAKSRTSLSPGRSTSGDKELPTPPCHPLHVRYQWEVVPALAILGDDERLSPFVKDDMPSQAKFDVKDEKSVDQTPILTETSAHEHVVDAGGSGTTTPRPTSVLRIEPKVGPGNEDDRVVLLDARGGSGLQLLCRAWCASVGQHALIGRSTRTCVACCVREAKALGMQVVIRV